MKKSSLITYLCVGGSAYLLEMLSIYVFLYVLQVGPVITVAVSFWIGFTTAFILQKIVTFKSKDMRIKTLAGQLAGYSVLVAWNYVFTILATIFLTPQLSVFVARTLTIATITTWNFFIYHKIFKRSGGPI